MIEAIARRGNMGGSVPLTALLQVKWSEPTGGEPARSAEEKMLRALGCEPTDTKFGTVTMCAAARDLEQIEDLLRGGLIPRARGDADAVVPPELRAADTPSGRTTMLPVLRHLLLRRLAEEPEKWSQVHQWLRDNGSESDRQYYALATRDVAFVTGWLADRLRNAGNDIDEWLTALDSITSAPNDLECDDTDPDQILKKVGWTEPEDNLVAAVARLVAAMWIARDPLSSADRREILKATEDEFRSLKEAVRPARVRLRHEADRFKKMAADPYGAEAVVGV